MASIDRLTEAALASPELEARIVRVLRRMYLSENLELSDRAAARTREPGGSRGLESARARCGAWSRNDRRRRLPRSATLGGMVRLASRDDDAVGPIIEEIRLDESWKGGTEGLRHVGRISQPERFMVTVIDDCGVGQEDIQKLRIDLPQLQPQFRGAATLGIGPDNFAVRGCVVGRVLPGNAADKAGIQSGDRILKIGETEVENFEGLVNHLRTRKVGTRSRSSWSATVKRSCSRRRSRPGRASTGLSRMKTKPPAALCRDSSSLHGRRVVSAAADPGCSNSEPQGGIRTIRHRSFLFPPPTVPCLLGSAVQAGGSILSDDEARSGRPPFSTHTSFSALVLAQRLGGGNDKRPDLRPAYARSGLMTLPL